MSHYLSSGTGSVPEIPGIAEYGIGGTVRYASRAVECDWKTYRGIRGLKVDYRNCVEEYRLAYRVSQSIGILDCEGDETWSRAPREIVVAYKRVCGLEERRAVAEIPCVEND